jgi:hypothetical protein
MTEYLVKVGFWLRAYDSVSIEAANDAEAVAKAKAAAEALMGSRSHPEAIDMDERRQGVIAYIDRLGPNGRKPVAEDIAFDADRVDVSS